MTYSQINNKIDGIFKRAAQKEQLEWERTRFSILCTIQPHVKKRLKATDIVVFDWEKRPKTDALPRDEALKIANKLKKMKQKPIKPEQLYG